MLIGGEPTDAGSRAQTTGLSVFGTIHPQLLSYGSGALQAEGPSAPPVRLASLNATTFASRFAPAASDKDNAANAPATTAALPSSSFNERFAFKQPPPRTRSLQPSVSFADRFGGTTGTAPSAPPPTQFTLASVSPTIVPVMLTPAPAAARPAPHAAARALVARVAPKKPDKPDKPAGSYRVASLGDAPIRTAYASVDSASRDSAIDDSLLKKMTPRDPAKDTATKDATPKDGPLSGVDLTRTAIYDIAAHVVYLPNGQRLEAHSGLAEHMDDLGAVNLRSLGPTPPGLYELTMRESRFHGIDAIRLNPVDSTRMYGRAGILAHPYMLGPNGQSNGCVSLKDYPEFLAAFRRGEFNRIMVVERLDGDAPVGTTATGWIVDKLKGIFGRS
jgi:type VI secretion system (T6SS) effector TldE1-like protein